MRKQGRIRLPRKGRSWTADDQSAWEAEVEAGKAAKMAEKIGRANAGHRARLSMEFETAWEERTRLAREAFALRQQMEQEQREAELAAELAADAEVLQAIADELASLRLKQAA